MLGSMTSLTGGGGFQGGSAGPSTATSTSNTTNNNGFSAASYNFGSNNGTPTWVWLAAAGAVAWYVIKKKR